MNKKLNYIILEDKSLILEYYYGNFQVDELIDFKKRIGNDKKYNPNFNVLSDIRRSEFLFEVAEVQKYVEFLFKNPRLIGKRQTVMVTNTPQQVVTSFEFDLLKMDLPVNFRVVSTFDAAYSFLSISSEDVSLVESLYDEFRKNKT